MKTYQYTQPILAFTWEVGHCGKFVEELEARGITCEVRYDEPVVDVYGSSGEMACVHEGNTIMVCPTIGDDYYIDLAYDGAYQYLERKS